MSLFGKKKDNTSKRQEMIRPPSFSEQRMDIPSFPTYEPTLANHTEIKHEIDRDYDYEEKPIMQEEKAIFVKINKYKSAIDTLELVKEKLKTAEIIIDELAKIREKEEAEFSEWQNSIHEIKEKLAQVDRTLFEV
ncbi:MAG: hypothetical protein AABX29_00070 [Nanoarchaeota archaeon]